YGSINVLQAGITTSEKITTVSPTYAREIQTSALGCTLDGLLRSRSKDLIGILNGADYDEWNPETDRYIPAHYSSKDLSGKKVCKEALQKEFGLAVNPDIPVIGMVARLTDQKGIGDLFGPMHGAAYQICSKIKVQFVVVGSGDAWCERELESISSRLDNFKAKIGYFERIAHLIEAGADLFMMPSKYEPCGLNQLYSLRYGTLPIVRRTGGLADTVSNYNEAKGTGTGFVFDDLTPQAIFDTTGWAVYTYYNKKEHFNAMRITAMEQRFSWDKSVTEYMSLYSLLLK
ncbi:TPA: glycosyltransferase, partial [bacterium]|nr:glycosyltransferase [bacterium]